MRCSRVCFAEDYLNERAHARRIYDNDLVSSPKRFANENRSNPLSNHRTTESSITRRPATTHAGIDRWYDMNFFWMRNVFSVMSSSDDEEDLIDHGEDASLGRIFQELKNAQSALKESRMENRTIFDKLTKKLGQFRSLALSVGVATFAFVRGLIVTSSFFLFQQKDYNLDRYRDSNQEENFRKEVVCILTISSYRMIIFSRWFSFV